MQSSRRPWVAPVLVGAGAAAVSAAGYWNPSLWTDEAATISGSTRTLPELWALVHNIDAVHGLYYLAMHFWIDVLGASPLSVRLPSVLAVGIGAAGVVVLGRLVSTPRTALLAGVVYAVLPRITWAGTEARSYALAAALAVWLTVVLVVAVGRGRRWWLAYAVLAAASVMLFLYLALVVVAHGVALAWAVRGRWHRMLPWLGGAGAAALAVLPFVVLSVHESGQVHPGRPTLSTALQVAVYQWFLGSLPDRHAHLQLSGSYNWAAAALVVAIIGWSLVGLALVRHRAPADGDSGIGLLELAVPWLLLPTLAIVGYSMVRTPLYAPRYLVVSLPALALLMAAGLSALPGRRTAVVAFGLLVALSLPVYAEQRANDAKKASDWGLVAQLVDARARPGDVVVYGRLAYKTYQTTRKIAVAYPGRLDQLRDITYGRSAAARDALWASSRPLARVVGTIDGAPRVWLITDSAPGRQWRLRAQDALRTLQGAGYHVSWSWSGPSTAIDELVPSAPS